MMNDEFEQVFEYIGLRYWSAHVNLIDVDPV